VPPLTRATDAVDYPLTDQQRRLWLLSRLEDGQALYNNTEWLELAGPLDVAALQQAFQTLVDRHESLRTVFVTTADADGEPRQRILPALHITLPCHDLEKVGASGTAAALHAALTTERNTAFDLAQATAASLAAREPGTAPSADQHSLIVCDGWSRPAVLNSLRLIHGAGGRQFSAPLPEFRPRDIAVWLAGLDTSPAFARCRDYWRTQLADADARAVLPADLPASPGNGDRNHFAAAQVPVVLPAASVAALRQLLAERQATPFMAVAAALAALLFRYGGREQVVIGTPVAGRERPGAWSASQNTLPLVLRLTPDLCSPHYWRSRARHRRPARPPQDCSTG
jgi:hypothetical protein